MDKLAVYDALCSKLQAELDAALGAHKEAADYATNEEARAVSKYDTQGLEASYLAAGQASHAQAIAEGIEQLNALKAELTSPKVTVLPGALILCSLGRFDEWFYLCPVGGGETLDLDGSEVTVITAQSPIGSAMLGKSTGGDFKLPNGSPGKVTQIL